MSFLFQIEGKAVLPNPETLLIEPFKTIWDRDESEKKSLAIQEFGYIEFMTSMLKSNPYREYPEDKKDSVIRDGLNMEEDWSPDSLIHEAMHKIIELQEEGSLVYSYWMANKAAAEKMIKFFLGFDINERNEKTFNPVYKPGDITKAINDTEKTLQTLDSLKKKVDEEVFEISRNKSNKEISPFSKMNGS